MRALIVLALLAAPAAAQDAADPADVAAMTQAIEAAGCFVTADNGDAVQAASGLDAEQTMAVIAKMYADGLVSLTEGGNMQLTNEVCG